MNSFSEIEKLELFAQQIHDVGIDITSEYANWVRIAYACASQGEAGREPFHLISSNYAGYSREECDKHYSNCLKTTRNCVSIGTIMNIAKDFGIELKLPRGRRPKSEKQREENQKSMLTEVKEQLQEKRKWRHNILTNKTEYCENTQDWHEVDDRFIDTVLTRLRESGLRVKDNEVRSLINSSDFAPDFAPHLEWLDSLPIWNPDSDPDFIHEFFVGHMEFGPLANVPLYDKMFHRWLVAMVALWRHQIESNPLMPTFCGSQRIGKSFMAKHVLPPCLSQYQAEVRPNDPFNTDTMLILSEVLLVIFDEISISSNSKSNMMKHYITSGTTNLRDAYGHYRKARHRMASSIATTNYHQFIRESEGNRRYLGIDLVATKNINDYPLPYEGAYAQAVYLLDHGYDPQPTLEESQEISEYNKLFMTPNDCEEALRTFVRHPSENENCIAVTAGDLMGKINQYGFRSNAFNAVNIGKAMKAMGFKSTKIRGYNKYRVVLADPLRQQNEQIEDAQLLSEQEVASRQDANDKQASASHPENAEKKQIDDKFDFEDYLNETEASPLPF